MRTYHRRRIQPALCNQTISSCRRSRQLKNKKIQNKEKKQSYMATVSLHFSSGSRVCIAYPPSTTMHSCTNIVPKSDHIVLLVTANVPQTLCIHKCTHFYGSPSFTLQEEYGKLVQKKQQQHCNNIPEKSLMLCQGNDDHIEVHTGNKHRKTVRHGHVEKSGCGN